MAVFVQRGWEREVVGQYGSMLLCHTYTQEFWKFMQGVQYIGSTYVCRMLNLQELWCDQSYKHYKHNESYWLENWPMYNSRVVNHYHRVNKEQIRIQSWMTGCREKILLLLDFDYAVIRIQA